MKLKDAMVSGAEVEVHVNPGGTFAIMRGDEAIATSTELDDAIAKAKPKLAKEKRTVNVPFITFDGERGFAYSVHAGSGRPMIQFDGRREQWGGYGRTEAFRADMPPEELRRWLEIKKEKEALRAEEANIRVTYSFDVLAAVIAEINV